jgi:hypothetical protein
VVVSAMCAAGQPERQGSGVEQVVEHDLPGYKWV